MLGNTRLLLAGSLGMMLLLLAIPEGRSECCYRIGTVLDPNNNKCEDCTVSTPYCGYGPCNFLGCNCDGGCRKGSCKSRKRSFDLMGMLDKNQDGRASLEEVLSHLRNWTLPHGEIGTPPAFGLHGDHKPFFNPKGVSAWLSRSKRSFHEMDLDSDGYLTLKEIDPDSC